MTPTRIPLRLDSAANLREHWAVKHKRVKAQRMITMVMLRPKVRPALPCTITLTRIAPKRLDGDNLQGAFKAVRDEVAAWLGVDDATPLVTWLYAQRSDPKPRTYAVEIGWAPSVAPLGDGSGDLGDLP